MPYAASHSDRNSQWEILRAKRRFRSHSQSQWEILCAKHRFRVKSKSFCNIASRTFDNYIRRFPYNFKMHSEMQSTIVAFLRNAASETFRFRTSERRFRMQLCAVQHCNTPNSVSEIESPDSTTRPILWTLKFPLLIYSSELRVASSDYYEHDTLDFVIFNSFPILYTTVRMHYFAHAHRPLKLTLSFSDSFPSPSPGPGSVSVSSPQSKSTRLQAQDP